MAAGVEAMELVDTGQARPTDGLREQGEPKWVKPAIYTLNIVLFAGYWVGVTLAVWIVYIYPRPRGALLTSLVNNHFPAIVGLPAAALMAFSIVSAFRATEGKVELDVLGIKLRGAAGPVLLWNVTFLILAGAIRALW